MRLSQPSSVLTCSARSIRYTGARAQAFGFRSANATLRISLATTTHDGEFGLRARHAVSGCRVPFFLRLEASVKPVPSIPCARTVPNNTLSAYTAVIVVCRGSIYVHRRLHETQTYHCSCSSTTLRSAQPPIRGMFLPSIEQQLWRQEAAHAYAPIANHSYCSSQLSVYSVL